MRFRQCFRDDFGCGIRFQWRVRYSFARRFGNQHYPTYPSLCGLLNSVNFRVRIVWIHVINNVQKPFQCAFSPLSSQTSFNSGESRAWYLFAVSHSSPKVKHSVKLHLLGSSSSALLTIEPLARSSNPRSEILVSHYYQTYEQNVFGVWLSDSIYSACPWVICIFWYYENQFEHVWLSGSDHPSYLSQEGCVLTPLLPSWSVFYHKLHDDETSEVQPHPLMKKKKRKSYSSTRST